MNEAIADDKAGNHEQALHKYKQALQQLITGIKYEKHQGTKDMIMQRVAGYMKRAEELKEIIAGGGDGAASGSSSGGGGKGGGGGGGGKETLVVGAAPATVRVEKSL